MLCSLMAQIVKNLPTMWEIWVQSLGRKDPVEKEMVPTPVFLSGEYQVQRSLAGYSPWSRKESNTSELTLPLSLKTQSLYPSLSLKQPTTSSKTINKYKVKAHCGCCYARLVLRI